MDLLGILVIYEYSDYIKGLGVLVCKYKFFIFVNEKMWNVMDGLIGNINME